MRSVRKACFWKSALAVLMLFCLLAFSACSQARAEKEFFAMDTFIGMSVFGDVKKAELENALGKAAEAIKNTDARFSVSSLEGEVGRLNRDGFLDSPSKELILMLECARELYERTDGAYDITSLALTELWKKCEAEGRLPTDYEIASAKALVGMDKLTFDFERVSLNGVKGIDLGSVAKGYAGTLACEVLENEGAAGGILDLGGNIAVFGEKPDKSNFVIGVTDPLHPKSTVGYIEIPSGSVVTSGKYNRCFYLGEKRYHHIIDVKSGYPCENGVESVTVVCEDGMLADALSTALLLMGADAAPKYRLERGDFEFVMVMEDGSVIRSDGVKFTEQ